MPHLAHIALIVRDYDEALAFYTGKLGFILVGDTYQPEQDKRPSDSAGIASKRWVTNRPPGAPENAAAPEQAAFIGNQTGGRVLLFLATDDLARNCAAYTAAGINFVREPATHEYGNRWDLVEFAP